VRRERGERLQAQRRAERLELDLGEAHRRAERLELALWEAQQQARRLREEWEAEHSKSFWRRLVRNGKRSSGFGMRDRTHQEGGQGFWLR
jgi:hypothetical protein